MVIQRRFVVIFHQHTDGFIVLSMYDALIRHHQYVSQRVGSVDLQKRVTIQIRHSIILFLDFLRNGIISHQSVNSAIQMIIVTIEIIGQRFLINLPQ